MSFKTCWLYSVYVNVVGIDFLSVFLVNVVLSFSRPLLIVSVVPFQVFTSFFTLEAVLKLLALSKEYFASGWNIFDLVIVIGSLIDLSVESVNGISVLRGMRLVSP